MPDLIIASRASPLALTQSNWVADELRRLHPDVTIKIVEIETSGDTDRTTPLHESGGAGLFTTEVDRALLSGAAQVAVHSLKDLPTTVADGLTLAAVPERESVEDVLAGFAGKNFADVPQGATIATGSLRRRAQLLAARPDLTIVEIRGNVETRLAKIKENDWAGTVLARAGLSRLGIEVPHVSLAEIMLPAIGQGALGIVAKAKDADTLALVAPLNHAPSRSRVKAERAFLRTLQAGCHAPVGALTWLDEAGMLWLRGGVFSLDGKKAFCVEESAEEKSAGSLGIGAAQTLLGQGAKELLDHGDE